MMLRLLCCVLLLFPHYALAGAVSIPGFQGSAAARILVPVVPTASASPAVVLSIPGFYNGVSLPAVPTNEVPVAIQGSNSGLDTSKGNQGIASTVNANSGQVTVYQNQQNAIINWQTFNIGSNSSVYFNQQGNAGWTALNRIWDANPSQIYGQLKADGNIYLINQNGFLFGPGSRVNVNGLVASALDLIDANFLNNDLQFTLDNYQAQSNPNVLAAVSSFGEIDAANGGFAFLFAPRVENFGTINAPAGQVGLAAGTDVLLQPPAQGDTTRNGYYVIVEDDFSTETQSNNPSFVSNDVNFGRAANNGNLFADGGMVGMYGNNVDQWGIIRSVTAFQNNQGQVELRAANEITTGPNSVIDLPVNDAVDPATGQLPTVDDTFDIQPKVFIGGLDSGRNTAAQIDLQGSIVAPAGVVTISASQQAYLETGSSIDVSGVVATLPAPVVDIQLNSIELRDDYTQKGGVLQGENVTTPITSGSAIGDISQAILGREMTAQERLVGGAMTPNADGSYTAYTGSINISATNGDIIVKQGALLNFSGGAITYLGGMVNSTQMLSGTNIYDIGNAPADIQYNAILGNYVEAYNGYGIKQSFSGLYYGGASPLMTYVKGYTQGGDAGTVTLAASTVVLDGQLNGSATSGKYQNTWTMQGSFANAQDYDNALALSKAQGLEAPRAGTLNIGTESATATNNPAAISILSATDPQTDLTPGSILPAGQPTLLSAQIVNDANLGSLNLFANLIIDTASNASIMLQPGGSFSASARQLDFQGQITSHGGSISLTTVQNSTSEIGANGNQNSNYIPLTENIILESGSLLDASGEKIDNSNVGTSSTASLKYGQTTGGSISIMDETDNGTGVYIQTGAVVNVDGGYTIDQKGNVTGGNAGTLSIQGSNIQLDGNLHGYALANSSGDILGGSITLASKEIYVGSGASAPSGSFVLAGDRLDNTGFTQITLNSINDLVVESGTTIGPSLVRLNDPVSVGSSGVSPQGQGQAVYGTELPGNLILLNDSNAFMAGPSSFVAGAGVSFVGSSSIFSNNLINTANSTASLTISPGAVIQTTPEVSSVTRIANNTPVNAAAVNTQISLSGPSVAMDGTLSSPGGNISVQATKFDLVVGDSAGDNASILATGYNQPDPSSTPAGFKLNYQPVNGGNVALSAFGNLTLSASAWIDVSGSEVVQNTIKASDGTNVTYKDASSPGSVSLTYGNTGGNLNVQGAVTARNAGLAGLGGGSLTINMLDTSMGMSISNLELGYYLSEGFNNLTLRSPNSLIFSNSISNMTIGQKLTLDAPEITGAAGINVAINAPSIVLTNTTNSPAQLPSATTTGSQITLTSQWIDVIGSMNFVGFDDVVLQAARDITLSQALYNNNVVNGIVAPGQLATTGNLVLDAERIYPGTYYSLKSGSTVYPDMYSDYTVYADGQVTLQHTIQPEDTAANGPIYSAGGRLTIEGLGGIDVENGVTLAAPLGSITLTAPGQRIYLANGSVVTTAGTTAVNYGLIDSNGIWETEDNANPEGADSASSTQFSANSLPGESITLNANEVITKGGSVIDVSGGGSIFAYAFQPGVQGSVDPLTIPGSYIVFKDNSFAMPGTAVDLQGGGGLSAGMYTMLPLNANDPQNARYAFLPGAYILQAQSATSLPGPTSLSSGGYPLVVGYSAVADTAIQSSRPEVFSVRLAQDVLAQEGNYEMQSATLGNAGTISITGATTVLDGSLKATALSGYNGGTLSLAATNISVQSSAASLLPSNFGFNSTLEPSLRGTLTISADSISGQSFSEVDLGNSSTDSVTIMPGVALNAGAINLTAAQAVTLESGASLGVVQAATGKSGTNQIAITTPGQLTIASGASVYASQGITLDVNNVEDISGQLKSDSGNLTLQSSAIFFGLDGGKQSTDVGLYLTSTLWNQFATFNNITLVGNNDIQFRTNFTGSSALSAGNSLTLDSAQIIGANSNGTSVTLAAPIVNLTNSGTSSAAITPAPANPGTFTVNANQINIGSGDVLFGGFSAIGLNSMNDLTFMGQGSLTTGNANLSISAARVTTASTTMTVNNSYGTSATAVTAANFTIYTGANYYNDQNNPNPTGSITITNSGGTPGATSTPGGILNFEGSSIAQGGVIQVDGGSIMLSAAGPGQTNGVTLLSGSQLLARGTDDAPGGQVVLKSANGSVVVEGATVDASGATIEPASLIDVSAGSQGDAGLISLQAPLGGVLINGDLKGNSQGGAGGSLVVDTYQTSNLNSNMINTDMTQLMGTISAGGFTESVDIEALTGNINIAAGQTLQASTVKLTADDATAGQGQINVSGTIEGSEGGNVELYAMNDLTIQSGGIVKAVASTAGSTGGSVLLSSEQGWVNVNGSIDVSGGAGGTGGTIYLRAQRYVNSNNDNDVQINLGGTLQGASAVYAEAVQTYQYSQSSLVIDPLINTWLNEAVSFATDNASLERLQVGAPTGASFYILPGIEVVNSGGNITMTNPVNFSLLGFDNNPGVLTIRAAGNLNINGDLTDYPAYEASGSPITSITTAPTVRSSWAFNLAAGADTSSADPLAVNSRGNGDLNIANGVVVYTESAPIRFASAGDTIIGTAPANPGFMINGELGEAMSYNLASFNGSINGYVGRDLTIAGSIQTATGDIDISVGRDLDLLVGNDPSNDGAGAIRTTGQLTQAAASAALGTDPLDPVIIDPATNLPIQGVKQNGPQSTAYYWRYDGGGDINLSVGRNVGKFSNGQWTIAEDTLGDTSGPTGWDMFTTIGVILPSAPKNYNISYGVFSADYLDGTAGLATMGGGNLVVRSGGDFLAQAGTFSSGNLTIYSGGNVMGRFLNEDGQGEINAMGNFGAYDPSSKIDERVQIELFNSQMNVTAQGEIQIGAVLNPTLASDAVEAYRNSDFVQCTYTPDTSISLSAGTDVTIEGNSPFYNNHQISDNTDSPLYEQVLPATVNVTAGGDIFLFNNFVMTSSPTGNLSLNAGGSVLGYSSTSATTNVQSASILMSDIAPQNWYGLFDIYDYQVEQNGHWILTRDTNNHGLYDPSNGTWSFMEPLHEQDNQPVTIQAGADISNLNMAFPKEADITAGQDIQDITYVGQNINETDVSTIRAGGDITMQYAKASTTGNSTIVDQPPHEGLIQGGPGVFMVQAGGSIDLGSLPDGIQAVGNGNNFELGTEACALVILSGYGFNTSAADIQTFFNNIRTAGDTYAELLAEGNLSEAAQLLQTTRQDTIDPLLGTPTGAGDINMTSSQISTSIGQSDIYVIANGSINLGLTALPTPGTVSNTTGITTGGGGAINIFSSQDVNVNESRVMTFYGGDITIWSDQGSINAGRGASTSVSAVPPKKEKTAQGLYITVFTPPAIGSGIRAVTYGENPPPPGNIHLFAPSGIIDAGEAGISGGQITLAALHVSNVANISFSAGSIGVPQTSEGASLGTLAGSSITQSNQATADASGLSAENVQAAQMVENIIAKWLEVDVIDFVVDDNNNQNSY